MIDVFKLGMALTFAAVAGITAIAAGLISDARWQVVLGRAFLSFIVSGLIVYIGVFLFDRLGYAAEIREAKEAIEAMDDQEKQQSDNQASESEAAADVDSDAAEQPAEGFVPLQTDELRQVASGQEL